MSEPTVWLPSSIEAELGKTETYIETLAEDVRLKAFELPGEFLSPWTKFYTEFRNWLDSDPTLLSFSTVATAREFQRRAAEYREMFEGYGFKAAGPKEPAPPPPPFEPLSWQLGLLILAGIAVAVFVAKKA